MADNASSSNELSVVVIDRTPTVRGRDDIKVETKSLDISTVSSAVKDFLDKIGSVLNETPSFVGEFHLQEFEVSAEITTEGKVSLLGTGFGTSANGGLKFVFRRLDKASEITKDH